MIKNQHRLRKQVIIKQAYSDPFLLNLLVKSLKTNTNIEPITRISFLVSKVYNFYRFNYFHTYQKLQCLITLSGKVHNRTYQYSRFFLNKQLAFLTIANTLK